MMSPTAPDQSTRIQELGEQYHQLARDLALLNIKVEADHALLIGMDTILYRGVDGEGGLLENIRSLFKELARLSDILTKREETIKKEQADKAEDRKKWKWAIIGLCITLIPPFLIQFFIFWVRIVPILNQTYTTP